MLANAHKICPACQARTSGEARFCPVCGFDLAGVDAAGGDAYIGLSIAGKYLLEQLIGEGAMGRVYLARQLPLNKPFAVKILAPHLMNDEASHARFASEAHNAASLNHPNCISVVDYGRTPDGITFIVMEFIAGSTLERIISEQHPLTRERIVDIALQILAALGEAHGLGILHRDLKPENILVQQLRTHGELAKVLDFGIAKLMDSRVSGPGLTTAGMVCGTPEYMSPEQARGIKLDARSDLYSVGVIIYQMITGRPPFESNSAVEILHKHLHEEPVPPSVLLGIDPDPIEAVCMRALAKDPAQRFASAIEFREDLIAATSAAARMPAGQACPSCGAEMRLEHRFCPSCGAAAPERDGDKPRRQPAKGSGLLTAQRSNEPTAEILVRSFPLPLCGREHAFERARAQLSRPQPSLRVRVLTGPQGIGKTRLADEIAALAESLGWRAYYVGADPSGAKAPLWPIRNMVAQLLELDPTACTTHDLGRVANLGGLAFEELPGLAELFELDGPAHSLELRVRRRECFASAVQALVAGGRGQPLLLVFDDIDCFDEASREVLHMLSATPTPSAVLMVATTCETELGWLGAQVEALEPLPPDVVEKVCRSAISGTNPGSSLPQELARAAPMTPLKLELTLRAIAAGIRPPREAGEADLVRLRLRELDADSLTLLHIASCLGERFLDNDLDDLLRSEAGGAFAAHGLDGSPAEEVLAGLHELGLLISIGNGERVFAHRSIHEIVYLSATDQRRELLHALASSSSRVARRQIAVRANHLVRAGASNAVSALTEAARAAERSFDDLAAADAVHAAIALSRAQPESSVRQAVEIDLVVLANRVMRSEEAAVQAIALIEIELRRRHTPADEPRLLTALGIQLTRLRRWDDAAGAFRRAIAPCLALGDRGALLAVYREIGQMYAKKGSPDDAVRELKEGLDMITLGEGPRAQIDIGIWRYLLELSEILRRSARLPDAQRWCEHALWQAERAGDRLGLLRCHAQIAWVLRDSKQMALAEQHLARALAEARHFGDRLTTAELLIERARARAARGRLAEAQRCCEEALRLARGIRWVAGIDHAQRAIALLRRHGGDAADAETASTGFHSSAGGAANFPQERAPNPDSGDSFPRPSLTDTADESGGGFLRPPR